MHSPVIVNNTEHSIVVFQSRGFFYNEQVLQPGEAVSMTRKETGGLAPYRVHVTIGDEKCLPTKKQSFRNMVHAATIPTAFVVGAFATAVSAGTLAGPSAALAPMVSGMVVKGVVIDGAAIAAGTVLAERASAAADMLIKKHPENFVIKSSILMPGERFFVVKGGIEKPLVLKQLTAKKFKKLGTKEFKGPMIRQQQQQKHLE
eukprot:CAMPEP_0185734638 /NCGR_PEP_ID=MMETSP1171-20130828/23087_1 /TAXON_ID=374046 /ORGANISM="Helicotheca tamensis, Strain CCMP826" /LENGTH=202 /DNA_ID=CAMNT_0028404683 /DNA_START=12 /DNA_END=620 /DNA_ORIENTATION=+